MLLAAQLRACRQDSLYIACSFVGSLVERKASERVRAAPTTHGDLELTIRAVAFEARSIAVLLTPHLWCSRYHAEKKVVTKYISKCSGRMRYPNGTSGNLQCNKTGT